MTERLEKQLGFVLEIDKEKNVFRQTHLSGHGRNENDAEHAWHMAIMAYLLREYANEPVDIARVMLMCLIHDIVEIDAGDTYAYDTEGLKTQQARENAAKERIFSLLPDDQRDELRALFDEFEEFETPESKFAHAMDNLQPLLLNNSNGGSDWKEHKVSLEQVYGRQVKTRLGSEALFAVADQILKEQVEKGVFAMESNVKRISLPITKEIAAGLRIGEEVRLNGEMLVARDAAHGRLMELIEKGEKLPIELENACIYYMGPSPAREGRPIGSAGPTTASRMDKYAPKLLDLGVSAMVGKGKRTPEVLSAIERNQAVYFAAIGGAGALISKCIKESEIVCYEDLGAEAIRRIRVEDFPVFVVADCHGGNLYTDAVKKYQKN